MRVFETSLQIRIRELDLLDGISSSCNLLQHSTVRLVLVFGLYILLKKYKTFSVLIYSYINTSENWKYEKLCGNTTPAGRSVSTQFRVFPIFTSVDITVYQ